MGSEKESWCVGLAFRFSVYEHVGSMEREGIEGKFYWIEDIW